MSDTTHSEVTKDDTPPGYFFFQRRFFPMWLAQCLGAITDNALKQALIIGLTFKVFSVAGFYGDGIIPFMGALFGIGMAFFSPYGGQFADKYETSFMLRRTKFVEFLIMVCAALGFLFREGSILALALFLMAAQSAFFNPTRLSAMPKYLKTDELLAGNALCSAGLFTCILIGYVIGGGLVEAPRGPELIAAILAGLSLIGWLAARQTLKRPADDPDLNIDYNWFRQVGKLVTYVREEPPVIHPLAGVFFFYFIGTAVTVLVPFYARDTLGVSGVVATLFTAMFAIGTLVGALSIALLAKGRSGLGVSTGAMLVAAITSVLVFLISLPELSIDVGNCRGAVEVADCRGIAEFYAAPSGWILTGLLFLAAFVSGMFIVPLQTAIQRRVQPKRRAQIISAGNVLNAVAAILGSFFVYTITFGLIEAHYGFLVVAAMQAIMAAYMLYRKRSVPEGLYDEMLKPGAAQKGVTAVK